MLHTSHSYFLKQSPSPYLPPISLILRGVNLSSTAKFPSEVTHVDPQSSQRFKDAGQQSHLPDPWTSAEVGGRDGWFVGHPLKDGDMDTHLSRLVAWGFRVVRLIVTWEALEHAGPGQYDETYIDYLIRLLTRCKAHGLLVFISPHQDVFSRFTGGCGAPLWVLLALGLAPRRLHQTGAAVVHAQWSTDGYAGTGVEPGDFPDMIWNTNLHRLASRHCFTMFWASDVFAPKCTVNGQPVGLWLQQKHVEAHAHLATRLASTDLLDSCVVGWDSMNEPHEGFIGIPDLSTIPPTQEFRKGPSPSPIQGFRLGAGQAVSDIPYDDFTSLGLKTLGKVSITPPNGQGAWLTHDEAEAAAQRYGWDRGNSPSGCPWAAHGVWDSTTGELLQPDYFHKDGSGKEHNFMDVFWHRHYSSYIATIRKSHPNAISFLNPPVFGSPPDLGEDVKQGRIALTPHFYDGLTMLGKRRHVFNADAVGLQRGKIGMLGALKLGTRNIKNGIRSQFEELKGDARDRDGIAANLPGKKEYPTLIGELGVPFDMKKTNLLGLAQGKRDPTDYTQPAKAMDELLHGCDGTNALSYTLWDYEPTNTHQFGDGWNGEDLSIFTYDDLDDDRLARSPPDLYSLIRLGSRGIESWCRPYPAETMGRIKSFSFDVKTTTFELCISVISLDSSRLWQDDRAQRGEAKVASEGYTLIYLPLIHYLRVDRSTDGERRVIGEPGSIDWHQGEASSVDLEVVHLSEGRLSIEGQWAKWYYPLSRDRDVCLKLRKWA